MTVRETVETLLRKELIPDETGENRKLRPLELLRGKKHE